MYFAIITFVYSGNFTVFHAKLSFCYFAKEFCKISLIFPQNLYISCQMYFYFVLCLCFIKILHKIKFYAFCMFAWQPIYFVAFSFQNIKFYAICNVWCSCSTPNVFCFKELPFALCGVSLKAIIFSFVANHTFLDVSCVLLVFKVYANMY